MESQRLLASAKPQRGEAAEDGAEMSDVPSMNQPAGGGSPHCFPIPGTIILTGRVQDRVVRSTNLGALIHSPRIRNLSNPGSVVWIVGMKITGFDRSTLDVDFSSSGSGHVGPGSVARSGGSGNEPLFDHDPNIIVPPNEQRFLSILSTATDFVLDGEITIYATQAIGGDIFSTSISGTAVPAPYYLVCPGGSIQAAINAASPGDTIEVKEGTYVENLTLRNESPIPYFASPLAFFLPFLGADFQSGSINWASQPASFLRNSPSFSVLESARSLASPMSFERS